MKQNITRGIFAMLLSSFLFALMSAEAKILSQSLPAMEVAFFRAFLMVILLIPILINKPFKNPTHKSGGWSFLIARAVAGGLSFVALFYNISSIPLGTATAFSQSMPIYIVLLSLLFLKERFSFGVIFATIIGFVGILLICNPSFDGLGAINIIFGIISGLSMAIAFLNLRVLKDYFNAWVAIFSTGVAMSIIALSLSFLNIPPFVSMWAMPQDLEWLHIAFLGLFGTLGQHYLTRAYMLSPAGIVAPIDYMRLVFSVVLGIMLGDALPNLNTSLGIVLIIVSGIGVGLPILFADMRAYMRVSSSLNARQGRILAKMQHFKMQHQGKLMKNIYEKALKARERLKQIAIPSVLGYAPVLSKLSNANIHLVKENLQITGAFKIRGAFNKIASLVEKDSNNINGVIAASAGNHAQGVAFAAKHFGLRAVIVMPEATPLLKVSSTKALGAEVLLHGDNYDEAYSKALELAKVEDLVFIHPFADEEVIAGGGSIALEMIETNKDINVVVVPVGGGGLISGIGSVYKVLCPQVRVIGVVASGADAMKRSFDSGEIVKVDSVRSIADGIAVRDVNALNFEIIKECVDEIVSVDDEEIANAILFLLEKQKLVVEGAGAAGVASVLHKKFKINPTDNIAILLSGGNIDITMLSVIIEKGLLKSNRKMKLKIVLVDKPGSLQGLTDILSSVGANIVQVEYDRTSVMLKYGDALITLALEIKGEEHKNLIRDKLKEHGYVFNEIN